MSRSFVLLLALLVSALAPARAATTWFVVAESPAVAHGDSFLLPLSDPQAIAQARALIAQGPNSGVGTIVTARIAAGADGMNRDVRAAVPKLWSWHVTEVVGFSDLAIELCDGWPGFVESDVDAFIRNTDGRICFWSYTVVEELAAPPPFAIHDVIDGAWYNPATPGQSLMIDVIEAQGQVFAGWFTYDYRYGSVSGTPYWITAQGPYSTSRPTNLTITSTTGGAFNGPRPVQNRPVGTLQLEFADCNHGTMRWTLDDGTPGEAPIQRLVPLDCD